MTHYGNDKASITVGEHGNVKYRYRLTKHLPDSYFECGMLCEVGQPYFPLFAALIRKHELELETRDGKAGYCDYIR